MANKPISMTQIKRIVQLKSEGVSKFKISQSLGIHRKTLDSYLFKIEITGKSYQELFQCSETDLAEIVYNTKNTHQSDPRIEGLENRFGFYTT